MKVTGLKTVVISITVFTLLAVSLNSCATHKPVLVEVTETHLVLKKHNGEIIRVKRKTNPYLKGFEVIEH